jgi:hypothetical protein
MWTIFAPNEQKSSQLENRGSSDWVQQVPVMVRGRPNVHLFAPKYQQAEKGLTGAVK